jgi:hypothetical protein
MPNDRHWSASMLLQWVLRRDIERVLSMVDEYGGCRIDEVGATRIQPPTLDDVSRAHTIDASLLKDEKAKEAVRRANLFVIPARQKIFDALCRGAIDGWARPNGSGDIVKIDAIQWAGLRLSALHGHEIALPVDSEGDPLRLPRPLADYLAGTVPAIIAPTVWPDPVFPAERAMSLWPTDSLTSGRLPEKSGLLAVAHLPDGETQQADRSLSPIAGDVGRPAVSDKQSSDMADPDPLTHSGFPGRPAKSKHLIEDEFRLRMGRTEALPLLTDEAAALLTWFVHKHPQMPRPTQKTIENNIRVIHRQWRTSQDRVEAF